MATEFSASPVGIRLARMRSQSRLTAQQLADKIPGSTITKTVITNLESGRKRDLTSTELMQVASALNVSPLALLVDTDDPWSKIGLPGVARSWAGLSNIEYAMQAALTGGVGIVRSRFHQPEVRFIEHLLAAEMADAEREFFDSDVAARADPNTGWTLSTPSGIEFSAFGSSRYAHEDAWIDRWSELTQQLIDEYRAALIAVENSRLFGDAFTIHLPPDMTDRVEVLRAAVVKALSDAPDAFNWGQDDGPYDHRFTHPLNPKTGRLGNRPDA